MESEDQPTDVPPEETGDDTPVAYRAVKVSSRVLAGQQIGPYRLLQKLGEGGMGEVYEAEQSTPVHRRVALKIIKRGMDSHQVVARFESERQALALMSHRAIARVLDAGETPDGLPYFVMELVKGVPVTRHCDTARLTTAERLRLFQQICEGVQHAHQKGIIHRDLKPSNVLVTTQEGDPSVKIIDFGVAKATAQRLTERTLFTELGQLVGTPEYMSPEQADLTASDIDTRSDVYALGVMLYELACGALPVDKRRLREAGFTEIQRQIREVDPPRPSTRFSSLGGDSSAIAERRRTDPSSLARSLRGDLDWIAMKALDKERTRRYGSAAELGADVGRHLRNEPVLAGPPSHTYRAAKFVRRHRAGVAAAALAAAALLVATGVSVWQADRAREAERRAQNEADTAEQVSAFLAGLFEESNPGRIREEELTAREVLDSGAARVERELVRQPRVQARLLRIIGEVYGRLGLYDASTPVLEKAIALNEGLEPRDPTELALSLDALAANHHAQGRTDAGLPLASRAIAILEKEGGGGEKTLGDVLVTHGNLLMSNGKYEEAEAIYRRAIALIERHRGPDDGRLGRCYNNIANTRYYRGDYEGALVHYGKGLEIDERALGRDHYMVATELHNMSLVLTLLGRYEEALSLEMRALEIREKVLGPHHWHTALSLANLGQLRLDLGRLAEAEALLERAIAIDEEQFEPDKSETAFDLDTLGRVYLAQNRPEEARAVFERSLEIRRRLPGPSEVPYSHVSLGDYFRHVGDVARAESEYLQALALASPDDEGSATLRFDAHAGLGRLAAERGQSAEARTQIEEALAAVARVWPPDHPEVTALGDLAP